MRLFALTALLSACAGAPAEAPHTEPAQTDATAAATPDPSAEPPAETPAEAPAVTGTPVGGHHKLQGDALTAALGADATLELSHPAFEGPLGDEPKVAVYVPKPQDDAGHAVLKVAKDGAPFASADLQTWSLWEVNAVMFKNVDDEPDLELVVISQYMTGIGPEGAKPFYANVVLKLKGGALQRLESVEEKVGSATTGKAVSNALK